jgi:aspartate aminotransferase-like enzyme
MQPFGRFFLPGPTEVRPEVLQALTRPVIGHRGSELSALLAGCDPVLRAVFRTSRPVYVASASATGLMEASVRNGVRSRALSLVNGAFSARYRDLVAACGRGVETYEVPMGEAHRPEELLRRLRAGGVDAVTVVHSETSTGVLNPMAELAEAVHEAERTGGEEILLLVDGVTSVAGALVEAEAWGLDLLLTGSQKALALPPGLAFACASPRLLARAATLEGRGQYFDLLEYDEFWKRHQTPNTPAVSLLFALAEQCRHLAAEGVEARAARHTAMAARCAEWVRGPGAAFGFSLFAAEGQRSPTVTCIAAGGAHDAPGVVRALAARGWTVGGGYGPLKDSTFRIGHMGDHTLAGLEALLAQIEEILA